MGWTFSNRKQTSKEHIDYLLKEWQTSPDHTVIAHKAIGKMLWMVVEFAKEQAGKNRHIICYWRARDNGCWGEKSGDESVHPYEYNCPLRFLKLQPNVESQEWRDGVVKYHNKKNSNLVGQFFEVHHLGIPTIFKIISQWPRHMISKNGLVLRYRPENLHTPVAGWAEETAVAPSVSKECIWGPKGVGKTTWNV